MWQLFLLRSFIQYTPVHYRPFEYMSRVPVAARACVCASVRILLHQPTQQCRRRWIAALYWRCGSRHKHHRTIQRTTEAKRIYYIVLAFLARCHIRQWNAVSAFFHSFRFSEGPCAICRRALQNAPFYLSVPVGVHANRERSASIRVSSCAVCVCVCVLHVAGKAIKFYGHKTFNGCHGYAWP